MGYRSAACNESMFVNHSVLLLFVTVVGVDKLVLINVLVGKNCPVLLRAAYAFFPKYLGYALSGS